jgi:hypothetical protein
MTKLNLKAAVAFGALALAGVLAPTGAAKAAGNWCAEAGGRGGYSNCGFATFQQCLDSVSGVGGSCKPNPRVRTYVVEDEHGYRVYRRVYR